MTLDTDSSPNGVADYVFGAPGTALTFRYTVADGHNTAVLGYLSVNALSLNGGSTIQSTTTATLAADLTLPEPGASNSLSGLSGFFFPVVIDTIAPAVPSIEDPVADDNIISAAERDADAPVFIAGAHDAASTITLCFGATDADDPLCADGITYVASAAPGSTFATTWSYDFDDDDIAAIGDGLVTLTAIAADAAGNTAISPSLDIIVDLIAPTADSAVANADGTSIAVTVSEAVTLTNLDGTEFTLDGTLAQVTEVSTAGTTLTLTVFPAIVSGEEVTLAWAASTGDIIADAAETPMSDFDSLTVLTNEVLDTTAPTAVSAAANAAGTGISVTLSEPVTLTNLDGTEFMLDGTLARVTAVSSIISATLTLTVSPPIRAVEK